jgi:hypothetical protein
LQVHEELSVGLAVHEVLSNDVVRPAAEAFIRNGLDFKREVEVTQIFEGNGWHPNLVLFGWNFDDRRILVSLEQVLDA